MGRIGVVWGEQFIKLVITMVTRFSFFKTSFTHLSIPTSESFKYYWQGLERWLSAQVWFPAPTSVSSQPSVILTPVNQTFSSGFHRHLHSHMYILTERHKHMTEKQDSLLNNKEKTQILEFSAKNLWDQGWGRIERYLRNLEPGTTGWPGSWAIFLCAAWLTRDC